jgi:hypothetical protein
MHPSLRACRLWPVLAALALPPATAQAETTETTAREMAAAAQAFLRSLPPEQADIARIPFADPERENHHFIPRQRRGIALGDLQDEPKTRLRALLASALSETALTQVDTIIELEALLGEIENNPSHRDPGKYHTSIFGEPSAAGIWGWRFEGHHISINLTLAHGKVLSATPSFLGANPAQVREGRMAGSHPLVQEETLARQLARSLHQAGKAVVFAPKPPNEILTSGDRRARPLDPAGVPFTAFSPDQQQALFSLIRVYTSRHRPEIAENDLATLRRETEGLHFGWAGSLEPGEPYYYRIQGPNLLIEVVNVQNQANHIHTVWRDRRRDFGLHALANPQGETP